MTTLEGRTRSRVPDDPWAAPERIVVAVDGPAAFDALRWTAGRAVGRTVDAVVVAAVPAHADPAAATAARSTTDDAARRLMAVVPSADVAQRVVVGDPCDAVARACIDADLLVAGVGPATARERGTGRTTRLALLAGCTTVLVPAGWMPAPGHVVVRVAGIQGDAAAVAFAAEEARRLRRPLTLVHTWGPTRPSRPGTEAARAAAARSRSILAHASVVAVRRQHPGLVVEERIAGPSRSAMTAVGTGAVLLVAAAPAAAAVEQDWDRHVIGRLADRPPCATVLVRSRP